VTDCTMDYDVYHDESQELGYWHGILLVPRRSRSELLAVLQQIRENAEDSHPIALKRLNSVSGKIFRCCRGWLSFGHAALIQNLKGAPYAYDIGIDRPVPQFGRLVTAIGAKFILFRVRQGHASLVHLPEYAARVETTFRMGLKGGLQLFSNTTERINIRSLHFDGHEHHKRHVDRHRILDRIGPLNDNVSISPDADIFDESGNHNAAVHQPFDDCQLLQLTDLIVGAFRTVLGGATHSSHVTVAAPIHQLAERWHEGAARMRNSRWSGGFCISECHIDGGQWKFTDIRPSPLGTQTEFEM